MVQIIKFPNFVLFVSFVAKTLLVVCLRVRRVLIIVINESNVSWSFPHAFRQRQTGEIFSRESAPEFDAEALEHGH